jgi:peptidoglycan/LPS O-acetylase OafA/YrhL
LFFPFFEEIKIKSTFIEKIITFISSISYSLYLLHFDLILWPILEYIPINSILTCVFSFILYLLLSFIVSYFNYQYFEIRMTNLRDHKLFKKLYSR